MTTIFKSMLLTSLRDKITLFYSALLPIGLLMGLGFYFDNTTYTPRLLKGCYCFKLFILGIIRNRFSSTLAAEQRSL